MSKPTRTVSKMVEELFESFIVPVRLEYPKFEAPTTWAYDICYRADDTIIGQDHKFVIIFYESGFVHICRLFANSSLEALKYCIEHFINVEMVFDTDDKNILYCRREQSREQLKEAFVDHWKEIWEEKPEKIELSYSIFSN